MTVRLRRRAALTVVLGLLALGVASTGPAGAMAPTPVFAPYLNYNIGIARSVAVADFTSDGRNDVIVTAQESEIREAPDHAYVFVQGQDGWFDRVDSLPIDLDTLGGGAAAGDVDGDGRADAAVATGHSLKLYPQRAGRLVEGDELALAGARQVEIADLDGDGRADLVGSGTGGVAVLRGLGDGRFAAPALVTDHVQKEVQVGDLTGDGRPDLATCELTDVLVFAQLAGGTFAPPARYPMSQTCASVAVADVDGDGRADVSTVLDLNSPQSRVVVLSQGAGGALTPHGYPTLDLPSAVKPGDMNGDGLTDLVVVHDAWKSVGVHAQAPDHGLDPERRFMVPYNNSRSAKELALGDVNGDNRTDVVIAMDTVGLVVLWGQPPGPSTTTSSMKLATTTPTVPPPGTPPPSFSAYQSYGVGAAGATVATGDFNGDGRTDVAMTTAFIGEPEDRFKLFVFYQGADGSLERAVRFDTDIVDWDTMAVAAGDFDGDGRTDLVVGGRPGINVFMQRSGTFADRKFLEFPAINGVDASDIDGDGRSDLVFSNSTITIRRSLGAYAFADPVDVGPYGGPMAIGDVTGDGLPDIATATGNLSAVVVYRQVAGGAFVAGTPVATDTTVHGVTIGDVTGDGRVDVLAVHGPFDTNAIQVIVQGADGTMQLGDDIAASGVDSVRTGDLNGDGRADVVAHYAGSAVGVLLQQPDGRLAVERRYALPFANGHPLPMMVLADFTGDRRLDVAIADDINGLVVLRNVSSGTPALSASAGMFSALAPARILDTRSGVGAAGARVGPGGSLSLQVTGRGGVPASGVSAVALNVTVVDPTAVGYLAVWPSGEARPVASNLNFVPGQTVPNLVMAKVGSDGKIALFNSGGSSDLVADVAGWYGTGAVAPGAYSTLTPERLLDTRSGLGAPAAAKVGPGASVSLQVTGRGGVPASGASAVVLNVTAVDPTASGHVTVWPTGDERPLASNLNFVAGQTVPNLVVVKVGSGGRVDLFNSAGTTHLVADVAGWFAGGAGTSPGAYTPVVPSRLLDTRSGVGAPAARVGPGAALDLQVTGRGGVPATGVAAIVLNVTVVDPTATGYLTAWPAGQARPLASNLNFVAGQTVPNLVVVKVGANGTVGLFNSAGSTHLVADVAGWYAS